MVPCGMFLSLIIIVVIISVTFEDKFIRDSDHSLYNSVIKFNILPAIFCCDTVGASHSSDDAIIRTFEGQRSVIVVHIVCKCTVNMVIGKRTPLAREEMNAISFAVSVLALPYL